MSSLRIPEFCSECDTHTGRAGRWEDSLYLEVSGREIGPLCEECYERYENYLRITIENQKILDWCINWRN